MHVCNMAEICQRVHHDHIIVVFVWLTLLNGNLCGHREPIVLPGSVYLNRLLWGKRKTDLISTNNSKDSSSQVTQS